MQMPSVMCPNYLIGTVGTVAAIGKLVRDVQNASEAAWAVPGKERKIAECRPTGFG
jgi:hypothetical protein